MSDQRVGQRFGDYIVEGQIGRGGMGVVFRARHVVSEGVVALKLMAPDLADSPAFRERFILEAEAGPHLGHPNIVPVFETGEADGELFIAMELIEGTDLKGLIQQEGRLEPKRALSIFRQAASALDAAHESGMVHRDVKPQNILIVPRETPHGSDRAYLTDFGLIRPMASETSASRTGQVFGSVAYMAPELIEGIPADGRADVYALGCVLYEALTGKVPFERDNEVSAVWAHIHEDPPLLTDTQPGLPGGLNDVVFKAMAKHPDDRFLTCGEFITELELGLGRKLAAVKYAHVRPLVARIPRRKTEREVWAPNFFPELSRVRAASRERFDWRKAAALFVAVGLLSTIQVGRDGGIPQAAADVAKAAGSVAESVVKSVTDSESKRSDGDSELTKHRGERSRDAVISASGRKRLKALLPTDNTSVGGEGEDPPGSAVAGPPQRSKIAWAREMEGPTWATDETDIWVMDANGKNPVRLTNTGVAEFWPSWSPDGLYIAYVTISEFGQQEILIMDADGRFPRNPGLCPGSDPCGKLAWAPDGRRVAYSQGTDLYVADLTTGTRERVVSGMVITGAPSEGFLGSTPGPGPTWSPDGRSLAFTCGAHPSANLCVVPARGGEPRVIASGQGSADFIEPEWSPTGPWIAFGYAQHSQNGQGPWNIYVQRPDGTGRRQLTYSSQEGGMFSPTWAPQGQALVYTDWSGSNRGELWRIGFDGSDPVLLISGGSHYTPDWWGPSQ